MGTMWRQALEQAMTLHRKGDLQSALTLYTQIVVAAPDQFDARQLRASVLISLDRPQAALDDLQVCLREDPCFPPALSNLAVCLLRLGRV
jgi:tetratricopeptide (TPR) repeat protein